MSEFEVEEEIAIRRTRREVFDFVADPQHLPAWRNGISRVQRTSERSYRMEGRGRTWPYEITAQEPGVHLTARLTVAGLVFDETYAFEGPDDRSWVRLTLAAHPDGPQARARPLLRWILRRQVRASLQRLRAVLEGPRVEPVAGPEEEPVTPA